MHIAICDDSKTDASALQALLLHYQAQRKVNFQISIFHDAQSLLETVEKGMVYHLFLLDVVMPQMTGIAFAKQFRKKDPLTAIVYTSNTKDFAIDAFSVKAAHYLLKPVQREDLFLLIDEIRIKREKNEQIPLECADGIHTVDIRDVIYVEASRNKVIWNFVDHTKLIGKNNFTSTMELLSSYHGFYKVHRSYCVHMRYIDVIGKSELRLQNGVTILIPRGKVKQIQEAYLRFQMEGRIS